MELGTIVLNPVSSALTLAKRRRSLSMAGIQLLLPIGIDLVGRSGLEEPQSSPTGVPPLDQGLHSRTLGLERTAGLLDCRREPFTADPGRLRGSGDALLVHLPCAFHGQEDEAARVGGFFRGATRDYAAPGPRPPPRDPAAFDRFGHGIPRVLIPIFLGLGALFRMLLDAARNRAARSQIAALWVERLRSRRTVRAR